MIRTIHVAAWAWMVDASAPGSLGADGSHSAPADEFASSFLEEYCVACHGPDKQKGKLALHEISFDFSDPELHSHHPHRQSGFGCWRAEKRFPFSSGEG